MKRIKALHKSRAIRGLFLLIGIAVFLYLALHFDFTQDDAYISFRYASNLIHGDGLVFNSGERVEGYTNFFWILLTLPADALGINPASFTKALGIIFGVFILILIGKMAESVFPFNRGRSNDFLAGSAVILAGSMYSLAYWSSSGLETACFAFFAVWGIFAYMQRSSSLPVLLALATLTRPEGFLVFCFLLCYDIAAQRKVTRYALQTAAVYAIMMLPFAAFKLWYYHSLLPNSFYAKTSFSMTQLTNGLDYVGQYFWHYLAAGLFLLPAIIGYKKLSPAARLILIFTLVYTAYIAFIGGDVLKVHRFFIPLMPLFAILALAGFRAIFKNNAIIFAAVIVMLGWQLYMPRDHVYTFYEKERGLAFKMNTISDQLSASDHSDFSVAASTIGLVGYRLLGHRVIDMLGLTDSTIARHPEAPIEDLESTWRESNYNNAYLLAQQPDYILFSTGFKPSAPAERSLFLYSAFWRSYRTIGFPSPTSSQILPMYKRYKPIQGAINRDIPVEFVQNFVEGINLLWNDRKYKASLEALNRAQSFYPQNDNPYIEYYKSTAYLHMNDFQSSYEALLRTVAIDSMVYEGYKDLYLVTYRIGDTAKAALYRRQTARLVPWYIPRLDSVVMRLK